MKLWASVDMNVSTSDSAPEVVIEGAIAVNWGELDIATTSGPWWPWGGIESRSSGPGIGRPRGSMDRVRSAVDREQGLDDVGDPRTPGGRAGRPRRGADGHEKQVGARGVHIVVESRSCAAPPPWVAGAARGSRRARRRYPLPSGRSPFPARQTRSAAAGMRRGRIGGGGFRRGYGRSTAVAGPSETAARRSAAAMTSTSCPSSLNPSPACAAK